MDPRPPGQPAEGGRFEVTGHFDLDARGAVVMGNIVEGKIGVGQRIATQADPPFLTVRGVDAVDNIREKRSWTALSFVERPSLAFVQQAFPVGTVLEAL